MALRSRLQESFTYSNHKLLLSKEIFHWHRPPGDGGFGLGQVAPAVNRGIIRIGCSIHAYSFGPQYVDIPDSPGASGKVIVPLRGYLELGRWAVIAFTAHFHGKGGSAFQELPTRPWADVVGCVRTE